MKLQDLERGVQEGIRLLEKSPQISRRFFLELLGAGALEGCAGSLQGTPFDPRFYYTEGHGFERHLSNGDEGGTDYFTSDGKTLVTAMGEGRVRIVGTYKHPKALNEQWNIQIDHFGGKRTSLGVLTQSFVNPGDYVGRNTIIGTAGDVTVMPNRTMSKPHTHDEYHIARLFFDLMDKKDKKTQQIPGTSLLRADLELRGTKRYGLELWNGQDFFTKYEQKNSEIIGYLDTLIVKAGPRFLEELDRIKMNPLVDLDSNKVALFYIALRNNARWLTPEEKAKVAVLIKEYANLELPLTLPFVNPDLYFKYPGFYQKGSTAKTFEDFKRQYVAALQLVNGKI